MKASVLLMGQHAPDELADLVDLSEEAGYDVFWYADERFFRDAYIGLTMAALRTRRIQLGPLVTDPYSRHPAMTAAAIASLAELAPGRVLLGLGAGGSGFQQMGLERRRPLVAVREATELLRRLLGGEKLTYQGEVIQLKEGSLDFRPAGPVPIYIGTSGRRMLKLAGAIADGVCIGSYASDRALRAALSYIRDGAEEAGRDPASLDVIARVDLSIASNRAAAYAAVKPEINYSLWFGYGHLEQTALDYDAESPAWQLPPNLLAELAKRDWSLVGPTAQLVPDALVPHRALAGTLDEVIDNALRIASLGIRHITVYPVPVPGDPIGGSHAAQIELFATQVMPQLRASLAEASAHREGDGGTDARKV